MTRRPVPLLPVDEVTVPLTTALLRLTLRLAVVAAAIFVLHFLMTWLDARTHVIGRSPALGALVIVMMLIAYAVLIATPFVPGIEIGVALMLLQGGTVAPFVYLATVAGLTLSYAAGSALPYAALHRIFAELRLRPACRLLERVAPLSPEERLAAFEARLPGRIASLATRQRYLLLGIAINVPGNGLLGGGGGLSLMAGLSHLYRPGPTLLTFAIAVAPVPLLVWIFDGRVLPLPS